MFRVVDRGGSAKHSDSRHIRSVSRQALFLVRTRVDSEMSGF
jgi:hypothetical protein